MTEHEDSYENQEREKNERYWQERKQAIQCRVTPEDFAIFLRELEQIEARVVGHGLSSGDDVEDEFIFASMRSVFYIGYVAGLAATGRE